MKRNGVGVMVIFHSTAGGNDTKKHLASKRLASKRLASKRLASKVLASSV